MKTIYKLKWSKNNNNAYIEFGLDYDNNKYLIGVSSEIEDHCNSEIRIPGAIKIKPKEIYLRLWLGKYVLSVGTGEFEIQKKDRHNCKFVLGLAGEKIQ